MEIKATVVKSLRERTGAGMMDCKKALIQAAGDFDKAEKLLKELGLAAAAKRSGKAANEGRIFTRVDEKRAAILELSCETDFVARNKDFVEAGERILDLVIRKGLTAPDGEIGEIVDEMRSSIKENIGLKRFETLEIGENDLVVDYVHGEGKIGVLVRITVDKTELTKDERVRDFAFDTALHVAAFNPAYLTRGDVDPAYLSEQEAIFRKQAESLDKPEKVIEGIIKGKLNKHLGEVVLVEQGFVKEEKTKLGDVAAKTGKAVGGKLEVADFRYYRVGGGAS